MTALGIRTGGLTTQSFSWLAKKHYLSENEVRDLDARYKAADLDRSGQLDKGELRSLLKHTIAAKSSDAGLEKFLDSQWHNVDRDGNGTVDFDEFLSLYAVIKAHPGQAGGVAKPSEAKAATKAAAPTAGTQTAAKTAGAAGAAATPTGKSGRKGLGVSAKREKRLAGRKATRAKKAKRTRSFPVNNQLNQQNFISHEVVWSVIRKNSSFLVSQPNGIRLTRERGNLTNRHSRYHTGLLHNRTIDISAGEGSINLRVNAKSERRRTQPARSFVTTRLIQDNRQLSATLTRQLENYRRAAIPAALARASRLRYASAHGANATSKHQAKRAQKAASAAPATTAPAQ